jgi:cytidyltransferase-like protein
MSKRSLFIGRWQPLHPGHIALINSVLDEGHQVIIGIRDTEFSPENPYSVLDRLAMIRAVWPNEVKVCVIPDYDEIVYGRKVGYTFREIKLPDQVEAISGTKIRKERQHGIVIWLTGNTGSGKTTLAKAMLPHIPRSVHLDGDEMRNSISNDLGLSDVDRLRHNLRVARLACVLTHQGFNVVVSVIAPFEFLRQEVDKVCAPLWVYVRRDSAPTRPDAPYEIPEIPDYTVDNDALTVDENVRRITDYVMTIL